MRTYMRAIGIPSPSQEGVIPVESLSPGKRFRALLERPDFIPVPAIWDPYSAKIVERMGLEVAYLGGYTMGASWCTSEPLMTLTEVALLTHHVSNAVRIPVMVDAGAGFGEPVHVMRTVCELEKAGACIIQIEDQIYPKRVHYHKGIEHVVSREEFIMKIKAALEARRDPDTVILARTDTMRTDGYDEAIARSNLVLEAGAEMVMISPDTDQDARRAPKDIQGHVVTINSEGNRFGRPLYTAREFRDIGYKMATYPTALLCPITQEMKRVLQHLIGHGETGLPQKEMITWRDEVENILGLEEYYKIESDTVEEGGS